MTVRHAALVICLSTALSPSGAQVFMGAGFSNVQLSQRALDDAAGVSLLMEKEVNLSKTAKWKLCPSLHISFLFSDIDRAFEPLYLNIISLSPKVSYAAISFKKIQIAPYACPYAGFLLGLQSGAPAFESAPIQRFRGGVEGGIRIDVAVSKVAIRIIPVAVQLGQSFYRQEMIALLFRL